MTYFFKNLEQQCIWKGILLYGNNL